MASGYGVQLTVILGNIGVQPGDSPPRWRLKNLSGVGGDEVRRCRLAPREGTRYQRMAMKTSSMASDTASGMVAELVTPPCLVWMVRYGRRILRGCWVEELLERTA
jgi:hypothetical protein